MEKIIYIAGIVYGSMVDGPGLRTAVFLSGCHVGCKGCHNHAFWKKKNGKKFLIDELIEEIKTNTPQKKITISGGEPLEQYDAVKILIDELADFDIGLYTSREINEVDNEILKKLTFIKTGKFELDKSIQGKYYGSSNQKIHFLNVTME